MAFDAFEQAKLQNSYKRLQEYSVPEPVDTSIDDLRRLAGVTTPFSHDPPATVNRARIMAQNNIKPGTEEWFKLWFARPDLTGEQHI